MGSRSNSLLADLQRGTQAFCTGGNPGFQVLIEGGELFHHVVEGVRQQADLIRAGHAGFLREIAIRVAACLVGKVHQRIHHLTGGKKGDETDDKKGCGQQNEHEAQQWL
ncbi:hypothetical protein SDC9_192038 [bioreactor metagenome]|uniref:Uncharacterized protein n=1 Tax=bioreactor metagenome TaxID=1076179 RepID=A0A645IAL6_9ZZZZ